MTAHPAAHPDSHPATHTDSLAKPEPFNANKLLPDTSKASGILAAAHTLLAHLEAGEVLTAPLLRSVMESAFDATDAEGLWIWKDAYEAAEAAQVLMMQKFGAAMQRLAGSDVAFLSMIEKLVSLVPAQTRRSEDMVALQQFSTPLPLAAVAALAAKMMTNDVVLEPSAGTGLLAVFARLSGARLHLNEIAKLRGTLLRGLFPDSSVTSHDAASIDDRLDRSITPSVVLMNPPFSVAQHVEGRFRTATAQHVLSSLARLRTGGRLVAITGSSFSPATKQFRSAFERIAAQGRIVLSVPIAGKVFAKHGTSVETRLTVIDKSPVGSAPNELGPSVFHPLTDDVDDLLKFVHSELPPRLGIADSAPAEKGTRSALLSLRDAARAETRAIEARRAEHPFDSAETVDLAYQIRESGETATRLSDTIYEPYVLQAIAIDNAAEHPTRLVQSAAMASVAPPAPKHIPKLPATVMKDCLLSGPQLESVIYAGDAHATHLKGWFKPSEVEGSLVAANEDDEDAFRLRKGWFLGDGTGCGKGRQVAGIILDNWLNGRRRAVWVSKSDKLLEDARRDWMALGGRESDIVPLARFRQGKEIRLAEGILFVTYAALRSPERQIGGAVKPSRLDQIVDWLGSDFDGVIAFDEGHAMANAAAQSTERGDSKASQQGMAGLALQNRVPDARVLYVSATGATVVSNLAYASRLGLWGTGDFPFTTRAEFVSAMESGGIAAMEIISRDLKVLGLYLARSLSYEGVEYEMLIHDLSPAQIAIYDSYAEAFQVIHNNLDKALEASGITSECGTLNPQAKSAARSAFESNKQRFFNHLITAMKCPSLIKAIEADLAAGHAAVIQVVSTSEALMERRLAAIPACEWHDLHVDITPREYVMDYLTHSFPVQLFEPYTDEDGNLRSRPAMDEDGNRIVCREAERRRDALIERLGMLAPVQGALDQLLWHFGTGRVAEVTGRKRRIVRTADGRLKVENRPASSNIGEAHAFMDDEKRILVFSDAGGTGRSYHADLGVKNRRLRVHYLLEPGWKADNAIQGLGRTNRTNQAQPPLFRPTATEVKGEKRFLSTIARRLDTLGAITKGQRETGGQNMFRAEDNLESVYARKALRQFFHKLRAGEIEACSYEKFQAMTGLTLDDADGSMKENMPPIQQFLNRCLALTITMQDAIFEAFTGFLDAIVEGARKAGTLDVGLETLRAERFKILDRRVIHEDPVTLSQTTALTIERTDRNRPMTLDQARRLVTGCGDARLCWNRKSKRAAILVKAPAFMDEDGVPILRIELIRPMGTELFEAAEFAKSNWEECADTCFEASWQEEVTSIPEFSTTTITMICGLLLPIWDRLPTENMRIYRLETEGGERVLGRLVTQEELVGVYNRLGLDSTVEFSAEDVRKAVMERRSALTLVSGFGLRRSLVMGQPRLELTDVPPTALPELKRMGCFTEIIQWKTRLFVPTGDDRALARLLEQYPVGAPVRDAA
ncbi:MAG: strawberry notch family protein [Ahrensia sp.]|nr:strawberry notch family protein [Ahrensia sp.]